MHDGVDWCVCVVCKQSKEYNALGDNEYSSMNTQVSHFHICPRLSTHTPHTKLDMSMARQRLKSLRSLSGTSAHLTMVTQVNIMVMNGWLTSFWFIINRPPHSEIKLFQTLTLTLQGQGHGCGQRARSYNRPSIISTHFLFISHQSDQQFRR